jgi:D-amino-acid dehydrogenase
MVDIIVQRPQKRVVVIGGGVIGITTAWACCQRGWSVTVVEAKPALAHGACYANGGQISVSHPHPWSSPQAPWIALQSLTDPDAPFHWVPKWDCSEGRWLTAFLRECLPHRHHRNAETIAHLGRFSLAVLRRWRSALALRYDEATRGILHLFFTPTAWAAAQRHVAELRQWGIAISPCSPAQAIAIEPALSPHADRLVGALYAPEDESGDARQFTEALAVHCQAHGVELLRSIAATGWQMTGDRATLLVRDAGAPKKEQTPIDADCYVLCAGVGTPALARPLLAEVLILPVKGYSLTLPIVAPERIPTVSLTDEARRIVASRLGNRWRIAGTAELAGFDDRPNPARLAPLERWARTWGGDALDWHAVERWAGLRPMTPSGVPMIGRTRAANVWINSGHGSLGWTLACGSAELIVALIAGEALPVPFPITSPG